MLFTEGVEDGKKVYHHSARQPMVPCDPLKHFTFLSEEKFEQAALANAYCLAPQDSDDERLFMHNSNADKEFTSMLIEIYHCG